MRISNLAYNELDKMNEVVRLQDSLIYTQMKHVDIVTWERNKFRERLEKSELEKIEIEKQLKQARKNVKIYSIAAFLIGSITTILLLY